MPDPAARDPHSLVFDRKGILWFTCETSNFVGRLDPRTEAVKLVPSPTARSAPYGIVVTSRGIPFYCEFGSNKLGSINPETMTITEHLLPDGARPRRLTVAPRDAIYYSDYARGYLGRFDPATGRVEEWASPGGPGSKPYGIAATPDGMVWYSESGVAPNTIVRFDPSTTTFSRWPIPSGGGVVRNMVAGPGGRPLHCVQRGQQGGDRPCRKVILPHLSASGRESSLMSRRAFRHGRVTKDWRGK